MRFRISVFPSLHLRSSAIVFGHFKCNASEGLSLYSLVRHFLEVAIPTEMCSRECAAYGALADMIDALRAGSRMKISAADLERCIETFLAHFEAAWGMEYTTPKYHWLLHFGDHIREHGFLLSCWALERKHKTPKRYGTDMRNTCCYDAALLTEVTCDHLAQLGDLNTFACLRQGLKAPTMAPPAVKVFVLRALGLPTNAALEVRMSKTCQHSACESSTCEDVVPISGVPSAQPF